LYDAAGKHHPVLGPLNMGACRGLNLLLGVSAAPALLGERWPLALIPLAYIAAVTLVSGGEVNGGRRGGNLAALAVVLLVLLALAALPLSYGTTVWGLPFLALLAWRVLPPVRLAALDPAPLNARRAVKAGVLSLIVLDAVFAAAFAGPLFGLLVLSLLVLAALVARAFAVT
ncbi:MAG TPA: hypothetical protein VNT60_08380, partial [Deinococcales bacterium]|nr:hypothetical protein [Deinococcales bacterium]